MGLTGSIAAAALVAAVGSDAFATKTVNGGGTLRTGSLSSKLYYGEVSANTVERQTLLVNDPDRPFIEITSVYYDRYAYEELGQQPRVTVRDIMPGPGYDIVQALVQIEVFGGPENASNIAYQELKTFKTNPLGTETGFVQMQVQRRADNPLTLQDESATGRYTDTEGFTLIDTFGIFDGPESVDTHAWLFQARSPEFNDADVIYEHLATTGALQDLIIGEEPDGDQYVVTANNIEPAIVQAPEPGSAALLAVGAVGLLARRRRLPRG